MDELAVMGKYVRYSKVLKGLGGVSLAEEITLEDKEKGLKRSEIQMAYRDKQKEDFDGSILDFVLSVSMEYLIWMSRGQTAEAAADYIISAYDSHPWDVVNCLRLFMKKPNIFYNYLGSRGDEQSFLKLATFWFKLYLSSN